MSCFTQTCTQTVTGRNFAYSPALDLIQNEFYLDSLDSNFLRRRRHDFLRKKFQNDEMSKYYYKNIKKRKYSNDTLRRSRRTICPPEDTTMITINPGTPARQNTEDCIHPNDGKLCISKTR